MAGDDIADALEEIRGYIAEAREATDEQRASLAETRSKGADSDAELEKERRAGVHGRDWQVLQERIDMKRTTASDVLNGVDHSPEAEAVRKEAQRALATKRDAALENLEDDQSALDDLRRAQDELARMVAQLGQFRGDL